MYHYEHSFNDVAKNDKPVSRSVQQTAHAFLFLHRLR